jgi:hypothetical protein
VRRRSSFPWYVHLVLIRPRLVAENLERVRAAGIVERVPSVWQICVGVLRMWHRIVFRSATVGTCAAHPVRPTWRARLLHFRPLRFPFLLAERAVFPLDLSGLASTPDRLISHLLGAHHDGNQFTYDLRILACAPGKLEELRARARAVVEHDDARGRWLRDLTVYERYHENLLAAVERAIAGDVALPDDEARDPDIAFDAYLAWCAAQPETPAATWRAWRRGELRFGATRVPARALVAAR